MHGAEDKNHIYLLISLKKNPKERLIEQVASCQITIFEAMKQLLGNNPLNDMA